MTKATHGSYLEELWNSVENNPVMRRESLPGWRSALEEIAISLTGLMTPGLISGNLTGLAIPLMLANYAYSHFVAATDLAFSGQLPSCYALLRMCIESVVYAHTIAGPPDLDKAWIHLDDTPSDAAQFKAKFQIVHLINALPANDIVSCTAVKEL